MALMHMIRPIDQLMMRRCFHLARRGWTHVGANPMVGAVITVNDRIIGEGWYEKYGGLHAEPNAIANVAEYDRHLLSQAHMYVSLEPCNFYGKTPPCTEAIMAAGIPNITIGTLDPSKEMSGKSLTLLRDKGINVRLMPTSDEGSRNIAPFLATKVLNRPYIILKYAISKDGYMGQKDKQVWLSNKTSTMSTHMMRGQVDGIMIGTNTAIIDNPSLTNRQAPGSNPQRIVLDRNDRIPPTHKLRCDTVPTLILTTTSSYEGSGPKKIITLSEGDWNLPHILATIKNNGVNTLIIEGGRKLLQSCIDEELWDQCHLYKTSKILGTGIKAPYVSGVLSNNIQLGKNKLMIISRL